MTPKQHTPLQQRLLAIRKTPEFKIETLKLEVTESIAAALELQTISKSQLADRLGTSRAYITKLLQGDINFTLETLQRVAVALDCTLVAPVVRLNAKKPVHRKPARPGVKKTGPVLRK